MVTPGLYRHYKGPLYRVLFVAEWVRCETLVPDKLCHVSIVDGWLGVICMPNFGTELMTALWSGNDTHAAQPEEHVVIYVALYDTGRVAARPLDEFEERVDVMGGGSVLRFERIGD
jgi:hypothetical protein